MSFLYMPTEHFSTKLQKIKTSDPPGYDRIMDVVNRLLTNPENADGKMHGLYNGRMKKYVGRRDYRLIYHWCEVCRKENNRLQQKCGKCDTIPNESVIFFDLYHKKDSKKFNRSSRSLSF